MYNVGEVGDVFGASPGAMDSPTSPQYAIVYDLLSEGEIEGLVDGVSSVFLNGTRLVSNSARSNTNPITVPSGRFRTGNTTVTANSGNLGETVGRYIILHKGANTSNSFSGNVGEVRLRSNSFFTANMAVNPYLISSLAPKIRIAGLGPNGREYVGTIQQVIDSNTVIMDIPFSRTATAQSGGIDLVSTVTTASANSITIANAPLANGSSFQILSPFMPTDLTLSDNRWNFKNTAVGFRTGTQEQSPIIFPDVPTASFLTSIEQDLLWGNEWGGNAVAASYSSAALGVSAPSEIDIIKVAIEFPAGLYQNGGESGNRGPSFAGFQIKFTYVQNGETKTVVTHGPVDATGIPVGKAKQNRWTGWLEGKTGYIRHENTTSFVKTLSIPVEQFKPFTSFSIIISRTNPEGTDKYDVDDATLINTSRLKYIECQILDKFSYPLSAYAALSIPAEGFNSPPNRAYHVRGIKVSVPSNYTTREENRSNSATYTGAWDGSFVTKYTNNPAWIFYDLATNKRYGLGKYIDSSMVDKYALYRIARYCDELVDDGKGGLEPRFTCNVYIYQAEEAYKLLRDLATTFRGITYWMQGSLVPVQDSPKEPIYTFTQGNILDGIFNYEYSGRSARYNEVNITWNNPDQFYEQDVLTVTDQTDIIKRGKTISMDSVAFGCTSEGQAYRVALWNMLTSQLETEFISFSTGMNGATLMPGDIINVQDQHLKAIQASGRIKSALSASNITLDRDITLALGSQYQLHVIYDGPGCYLQQATATIGATTYVRGDLIPNIANSTAAANLLDNSGNPVTVSFSPETHVQRKLINNSLPYTGNNVTLSSGFLATPNVESIWALENITLDNNVEPKKYRILSIKEEQNGTYSIMGSIYAVQKFAELESKVKIQPPKYIGPRPGDEVPAIQNLNITYSRAYDGNIDTALDSSYYALISWTPGLETYLDTSGVIKTRDYPYIGSYEIQHDFFDVPSTSDVELTTETVSGSSTSIKVYGVAAGIYNIKVRAKNVYGQYSSWISRRVPLVQQSVQPGFTINGIVSGGALDSGIIFSSNTFTVLDSYYTFTTPSGRIYTIDAATSAQSSQSFSNLRSNSDYYLLWSASNTTDPWKAVEYYSDPFVLEPYGVANSYWKEATATSNGLTQLSGTINVAINTNKVIGTGTFFYDILTIGGLVKLQSSNVANSFYATVAFITSNTEFYTRETITKSFTAQTIFIPSLPIKYKNDTIAAKIRIGNGNVASLDTQYLTSAVEEKQTVALTSDSQSFIYYANNTLVGPNSLTVAVNRQALSESTFWSVANSTNHNIGNTVLTNKTNVTAELTAENYATINNNNIVKITANVGSFSNTIVITKVIRGARAGETLFDSLFNSLNDQEIKNQLITVNSTGHLQNTGSATQVENSKITVNSTGYLQNTGSATQVENTRITINADGYLQNTGSNFDVYNRAISILSTGVLSGIGTLGIQVQNNLINVNSTGYLQNTGSATQVENARITINADGYLQNTGSNFDVYNRAISILSTGVLSGIGTAGIQVQNNLINVNSTGYLQNTGSATQVENARITINATGHLQNVGSLFRVDNNQITVDGSGILNGIGTASIVVNNQAITIPASGILSGIGTAGIQVQNNLINVNSTGYLQNTGSATQVENARITINATGHLQNVGSRFRVDNNQITVDGSGILNGIGTASIVVNNQAITIPASGILSGIGTSGVVVNNQAIKFDGGKILGIGTGNNSYIVQNLEDSSLWAPSNFPWAATGGVGNTSIILDVGPKGSLVPILKSNTSTSAGPGGGWSSTYGFRIDPTKTYRYSVPFKVINISGIGGSIYLGPTDYFANTVCNLNTQDTNTNPYFHAVGRSNFTSNNWYLMVGYVYPSSVTTATNESAAIYDMNTGQVVLTGTNFTWNASSTTSTGSRAFTYYGDPNNWTHFAPPTVEVVNGSEMSINQLLQGSAIFNRNITVNSTGHLQNTGSATQVENARITINATGHLQNVGSLFRVDNNQITVDGSGILNGIGTASIVVNNQAITIPASGILSGIGTAGIQVQNNLINVNSTGHLQNTGSATQVDNARITINATGHLQNVGSAAQVDNSKVTLTGLGYTGITYSEKAIVNISGNTVSGANSHYQPKIGFNDIAYKWAAGGTNWTNGNRTANSVTTLAPHNDGTNRPYLKTFVSFNTTDGTPIKEFEFLHLANFGPFTGTTRILNRMISAWTDIKYAPYIGINERAVKLEGTVAANTAQTVHYFATTVGAPFVNEYASPTLTLRAYPRNTSGTVYYEFIEVAGNKLLVNSTASTYAFNFSADILDARGGPLHVFEVRVREGSSTGQILASDRFIVVGAYQNFTGFNLSNPTPTVTVSSAGVLSYANTGTDIVAFNASTTLDNYDSTLSNGTWRISTITEDGITCGAISLNNLGVGANTIVRIGDHSNMTKDIAKITYTIEIKDGAGVVTTKYATQTIGKSVANYNPYPDSDFKVDIGTNLGATVCPRNYETASSINYIILPSTSRGSSSSKYDITVKHVPTNRQVTTTCEIIGSGAVAPLNEAYDGIYSGSSFSAGTGLGAYGGGAK